MGSLLRTAEGLGVQKVYLTGYTPYPLTKNETRLPHIAAKITKDIQKTALGAEHLQPWEYVPDAEVLITALKKDGFAVYALEQTKNAVELPHFQPSDKCALILGNEVTGVQDEILATCDTHLIIPMYGQKESFNVVQAAAMALFQLRFA